MTEPAEPVPPVMESLSPRPHRRLRLLPLLLVVAFVAAACSGGGGADDGSSAPNPAEEAEEVEGGGDLPDVEFELVDGGTTTLAGILGERPLVVNFFASWCPPCRAEMPDLQAVYADTRDRVDFLGIDMQDTKDAGAELIELTGVEYPWGLDPDGTLYAAIRGFSMPTTLFISPDGEILDKVNGAMTESQLRSVIEESFGVAA